MSYAVLLHPSVVKYLIDHLKTKERDVMRIKDLQMCVLCAQRIRFISTSIEKKNER